MVREWHDLDGWGVLDSDETPGGCWAHYSNLDMAGFRTARPGQRVEFDYERGAQDGYGYRAVTVRLEGVTPAQPWRVEESGSAYWSLLHIEWDDDR